MTAKTRNRDMWKNIPWERRAQIAQKIKRMPDGLRKQILVLAFIENMSTADIERYAIEHDTLYSRNHKPISKRRVLQIIAEEIPDYNAYQKHWKCPEYKDYGRFTWRHEKTECALCGSTDRLEWHHMIPAKMGGTAERENMICLCHTCHNAVTDYHRKIFGRKK